MGVLNTIRSYLAFENLEEAWADSFISYSNFLVHEV